MSMLSPHKCFEKWLGGASSEKVWAHWLTRLCLTPA